MELCSGAHQSVGARRLTLNAVRRDGSWRVSVTRRVCVVLCVVLFFCAPLFVRRIVSSDVTWNYARRRPRVGAEQGEGHGLFHRGDHGSGQSSAADAAREKPQEKPGWVS